MSLQLQMNSVQLVVYHYSLKMLWLYTPLYKEMCEGQIIVIHFELSHKWPHVIFLEDLFTLRTCWQITFDNCLWCSLWCFNCSRNQLSRYLHHFCYKYQLKHFFGSFLSCYFGRYFTLHFLHCYLKMWHCNNS